MWPLMYEHLIGQDALQKEGAINKYAGTTGVNQGCPGKTGLSCQQLWHFLLNRILPPPFITLQERKSLICVLFSPYFLICYVLLLNA